MNPFSCFENGVKKYQRIYLPHKFYKLLLQKLKIGMYSKAKKQPN